MRKYNLTFVLIILSVLQSCAMFDKKNTDPYKSMTEVELYNEAEIAIVPSLYEGFSLPAIEAMSCGVPLIATTGGALPEVVGVDGVTALQVPPGDSDALTQKISWALQQTNLRSTVGAAGRERVMRNFSWKITAERTVEHYRALLLETRTNAHS
mgnify:CR=1 FL=1